MTTTPKAASHRDLESDLLRSREDPAFLLGRAYAIRLWISGLAEGGPARVPSDRWSVEIFDQASRLPIASAGKLARMTAEDLRRARRRNPQAAEALEEDLLRCMAGSEGPTDPMTPAEYAAWELGYARQQTEYLRRGLEFAREELAEAVESAKAQAVTLVKSGMSEAEAARRCGLDRMTVRKALGK